jgi:hypothetical protein
MSHRDGFNNNIQETSGSGIRKVRCSAVCLLFPVPSLLTKANVQYGCGKLHLPADIITIIITVVVFIAISSTAK